MYEIWVWTSVEQYAPIRGIKINGLKNAIKFFESCKLIEDATSIEMEHNGNTFAETNKVNGKWN